MNTNDPNQNLFSMLGRSAASTGTSWLRRRMIPILIVVAVVAVVFFITIGASLPDDGDPVPVSGEAAMSLVKKVQKSVGDAPGTKSIAIEVTDQEVTSFLAIATLLSGQIEDAGGTGDLGQIGMINRNSSTTDIASWKELIDSQDGIGSILTKGMDLGVTIRDPEVKFTSSGEIIIRGYGKIGPLSVPARAVVAPRIVNGNIEFEIIEGQLGRLPLPGGVSNLVAAGIEKALLAGHSIASVNRIDVSQGTLAFSGTVTK
ncbi:MAG: hypothetical protein DWP92_00980 [Armatimonadetes bacterium]|nr:MAG: hypothetical protein DWP92_00980 [Armatimonadota bacterium]